MSLTRSSRWLGRGLDVGGEFAVFVAALALVEQFSKHDDAVQRRADLVADGGEEFVLGFEGGLQLILDLLEFADVKAVSEQIGGGAFLLQPQ